MPTRAEFVGVSQAARLLGMSERRVQQLAASGDLTFAARGLVDRISLEQLLATRGGTHTRAWSTETAWAAVALLCGADPAWIGAAQKSRLRRSLRTTAAHALVSRTRNRARIHHFAGHRSTATRLSKEIVTTGSGSRLGLTGDDERLDGYVETDALAGLVARHSLSEDAQGPYTLRATDFDLHAVAAIASAGGIPVLAALDSAQSLDARKAGVGLEALEVAVNRFRG